MGGLAVVAGLGPIHPALAQPTQTPEQVYRRLMATPFRSDELPDGYKVNAPSNPSSGLQSIEPGIPGLIGAAVLQLRGPDLTNTIWYYVYASEAEALEHFENGKFGRTTTSSVAPGTDLEGSGQASGSAAVPGAPRAYLTVAYEPSGFAAPAWCVAARAVNWSWTSCAAVAGFVDVVGYSAIQAGSGAQRGNDAHAIALAQAARTHLDRLA
jgi:hypothetical protein